MTFCMRNSEGGDMQKPLINIVRCLLICIIILIPIHVIAQVSDRGMRIKGDVALSNGIIKGTRWALLIGIADYPKSDTFDVQSLKAPDDYPLNKLKYIHEIVQPFPVFPPDLIALANWMKTYYAASSDTIYEAMIPAAVRKGMKAKTQAFLRLARRLEAGELDALRKKAPRQAEPTAIR